MLILPIKKKWYDMILSGEKKEEYREQKYYYDKRFQSIGLIDEDWMIIPNKKVQVMFRNGYSSKSPYFIAEVSLTCGEGKEEWGAENGVEYYKLHIEKIWMKN